MQLGHVFGLVFKDNDALNNQLEYVGTEGLKVWNTDWGCMGTPPVQTPDGRHWAEDCFSTELMSPTSVNDLPENISALTIAMLKDLKYPVAANAMPEVTDEDTFLDKTVWCDVTRRLHEEEITSHLRKDQGRRRVQAYRADVTLDASSTPLPVNVSTDKFESMRSFAMTKLSKARKNRPAKREVGGVRYVADLYTAVFAYDNNGNVRSTVFEYPESL